MRRRLPFTIDYVRAQGRNTMTPLQFPPVMETAWSLMMVRANEATALMNQ
jgi:hypothetical protein